MITTAIATLIDSQFSYNTKTGFGTYQDISTNQTLGNDFCVVSYINELPNSYTTNGYINETEYINIYLCKKDVIDKARAVARYLAGKVVTGYLNEKKGIQWLGSDFLQNTNSELQIIEIRLEIK